MTEDEKEPSDAAADMLKRVIDEIHDHQAGSVFCWMLGYIAGTHPEVLAGSIVRWYIEGRPGVERS